MNYEKIESLLTEAEEENNKSNFEEAERLCNMIMESHLIIHATLLKKPEYNSYYESIEDFMKAAIIRSRVLNQLSISIWRRGMSLEGLPAAKEALELSIEAKNMEQKSRALNSIGSVYFNLSDYTNSLEYYTKALAINEEIRDKKAVSETTKNIGNSHYKLSDYPLALEYFSRALAIDEEIKNEAGIANNNGNIGEVYRILSDYPLALEYFSKELAMNEKTGNKLVIMKNIGNIGNVYWNLSDYPRAMEYFTKALTMSEEIGDKFGIARASGNIGVLCQNLSDYPRALEYYTKALAINEKIGNKAGIATNTGNIGTVYHDFSNYSLALEYYTKALAMFEEMGDKNGITINIENIGHLYIKKEFEKYDAKKGETYLLKAIALNKEIGQNNIEGYKSLAELYKSLERWQDALKYYELFHDIEREVLSEEATKQAQLMENRRKVEESERDRQVKLARFQEQEKILLNILPAQIAERILEGEKRIADLHEHVSVFFSDIVGFTKLSQTVTPDELLSMLNEIFSEFDRIARKHGLEKIKTIGDAYMAVAGVPMDQEDHAERAAAFAIDVIEYMKEYRKISHSDLQIRVGLHCGRAIAGVIGENKFAYDLWGDSVNTASRMESHGEAGMIHVSEDFRKALESSSFQFTDRGEMEVKGKGMMKTYFLKKES